MKRFAYLSIGSYEGVVREQVRKCGSWYRDHANHGVLYGESINFVQERLDGSINHPGPWDNSFRTQVEKKLPGVLRNKQCMDDQCYSCIITFLPILKVSFSEQARLPNLVCLIPLIPSVQGI